MISKRKLFRLTAATVAVLLVTMGLLAGCGFRRPAEENNNVVPSPTRGADYDTARVDELERDIADLAGVQEANVVLSTDTAWVALVLDETINRGVVNDTVIPGETVLDETTPMGTTIVGETPAAQSNASGVGNGANVTGTGSSSAIVDPVTGPDTVNGTGAMAVSAQLRDEVTQLVKEKISGIQTVYVTADAAIRTEIQGIRTDLHSGRRVLDDVWEDLKDIGRRITGME